MPAPRLDRARVSRCLAVATALLAGSACDDSKTRTVDIACSFSTTPAAGLYNQPQVLTVESNFPDELRLAVVTTASQADNRTASLATRRRTNVVPDGATAYSVPVSLAEGEHDITVFDPCAGDWLQFTVAIDETPPGLGLQPAPGVYRPPLAVTIDVSGTSEAYYRLYSVDGTAGAFVPVTGGIVLRDNADWRLDVLALDAAGNATQVSGVYTIDSAAPLLLSIATPGGFGNAARWPRFDAEFDLPMDTSVSEVTDAFVPQAPGAAVDALVYWQDSRSAAIVAADPLQSSRDYVLDLTALRSGNQVPLASYGVALSSQVEFRTATAIPTPVYGTIAATATTTTLAWGVPVTATLRLVPPPPDPATLSYVAQYDVTGSETPASAVGTYVQTVAVNATEALVTVEFAPAAVTRGRVSSLSIGALTGDLTYIADDTLGIYWPDTGDDDPAPTFSLVTSGTTPAASAVERDIFLEFSRPPAVASFAAGITATRQRGPASETIAIAADYLGGTAGRHIRLQPLAELQPGDIVTVYGDAAALSDLSGQSLDFDFVSQHTFASQPAAAPALVQTNLDETGGIWMQNGGGQLALHAELGAYTLQDWSAVLLPQRRPATFITRGAVALPQRGAPLLEQWVLAPQVDPLPDGTQIEFRFEIAHESGSVYAYTATATVAADAQVRDVNSPMGTGAILHTPSYIAVVGASVELAQATQNSTGNLLGAFANLIGEFVLNPASPGSNRMVDALDVATALTLTTESEATSYAGRLLADYTRTGGDFVGQRLFELLPEAAIPQLLSPAPAWTTNATTVFSWNVTIAADALDIMFAPSAGTASSLPSRRWRLPAESTQFTLPSGTLPAGDYYWTVLNVRNVAAPFNPVIRTRYDTGYAAATTRALTIAP